MRKPLFSLLGIVAILLAAAMISGCGAKAESKSSGSGGGGDDGTIAPPPTVDVESPLALKIYTTYFEQTFVDYQTFTQTATTTCEVSAASPIVSCTIVVPEARLFYSTVSFQFSWLGSECPLLYFTPYSYRAAALTEGAFLPPWAGTTAIDCTSVPTPPTCWGGAGPDMIAGWPYKVGLVFSPDESVTTPLSKTLNLKSSFERNYGSNRGAANDLQVGSRAANIASAAMGGNGDKYMANTFQDYYFECRDHHDDPTGHAITVTITEENSEGGDPGLNHHRSFKEN